MNSHPLFLPQPNTCTSIKKREYPAAVLSVGSESMEEAKEEDSGSEAMDRHFKLNLGLTSLNLELRFLLVKLHGDNRFTGYESAETRPKQSISLFCKSKARSDS